ncbi:glutaredoxin domain-containing protein [Kribbella sp. NPDC026596]|uniref:glutaredoxin domain-containing protein n=1 Tax=Kribbella sp. NPDC026596 TaxID=3155122 RepID=UPI0033EF0FEB
MEEFVTGNRAAATVYWRPGCPSCGRLLGDLERIGLPIDKVDIWADRGAAARVRAIADGNETVPIVVVGDTAMVNPRAADVVDAVRGHTPDLLNGLDAGRIAAVTRGRWYTGLGLTLVVALGWFALAATHPTTTYHLAPAVVAAAWPVGRRLRTRRALPTATALLTALGSTTIAITATVLLLARDELAGPALLAVPVLTETLLSAALGALAGAAFAARRSAAQREL